MNTILITGATGGLGGAVARKLKTKNPDLNIAVLVRDLSSAQAKELEALGFELRLADYSDRETLVKAFQNVAQLYFVSGSDIANRTQQHENVVWAAKEAQVAHILYTGVSMRDIDKNSALYGALKIHEQTEAWIQEAGLNYTFLRHNLYAEVILMFLGDKAQLLQTKAVYLPTGEGKTAFVAREELAEAGANVLANASNYLNKALEFNGSEKVSFGQIATYLSEITGESIAYVSPELQDFEKTMSEHGVPAEYIGMMSSFGEGIANRVFDTPDSDLEAVLGRKTQSLKSFLTKYYS